MTLRIGQEVIIVGKNGCMEYVGQKAVILSEERVTGPVRWYMVEVFDKAYGGTVYARMIRCDLETEDEYREWIAKEEAMHG